MCRFQMHSQANLSIMNRGFLIFLFFVAHFTSSAQGVQHTIDVNPMSLFCGQNIFMPFGTQGLNYQLNFRRHTLEAAVDGVLFGALDGKISEKKIANRVRKYLDISAAYKLTVVDREQDEKRHRLNVLLGYAYVQHINRLNTDYWYTNQREDGSYDVLQSRNIHLAKVGVEWNYIKSPKGDEKVLKSTSSFTLRAEYFYGLTHQLTGINGIAFNLDSPQTTKITLPNSYDFNPHGGKLSFQYRYYLLSYLSIVSEYAIMYYPTIQFEANHDIFVPRGGEYYIPFYSSMKLGVGFHLTKKSP